MSCQADWVKFVFTLTSIIVNAWQSVYTRTHIDKHNHLGCGTAPWLPWKRKGNKTMSVKRFESFKEPNSHTHIQAHTHTSWRRSCINLAAINFNILKDERRREIICLLVLLFYGSDVSARKELSRPGSGLKQRGAVYVVIRELAMVSLARGWLHTLAWCGWRKQPRASRYKRPVTVSGINSLHSHRVVTHFPTNTVNFHTWTFSLFVSHTSQAFPFQHRDFSLRY